MIARLTDERIQAIKAKLERDPYANIPDSAFRQAGASRPKPDDVPVELNRADVRALLADREEAREALRMIIDEAHSSERNSVDSLIEIIDIAGRALGEES